MVFSSVLTRLIAREDLSSILSNRDLVDVPEEILQTMVFSSILTRLIGREDLSSILSKRDLVDVPQHFIYPDFKYRNTSNWHEIYHAVWLSEYYNVVATRSGYYRV
jgi:hypothetical protein